jgi:aspartate carbamoyltransferase catalytic subunit
MRHLMTPLDLSVEELEDLMDTAEDIKQHPEKYAHACDGRVLATLFYEPSTRTRLSFEAAMLHLGGKTLGFADAGSSSAAKGESVADTIRVASCFADIAAMRHFKEGAPWWRHSSPAYRSSMPVTVDTSIPRRPSQI